MISPAERAKSDTTLSLLAVNSAHYMLHLCKNKRSKIDVSLPCFQSGRSAARRRKTHVSLAILARPKEGCLIIHLAYLIPKGY